MTKKSIIIIGAGLAGLSTGIYGQMNGYRTRIFEHHKIPGGVCTAWKRKGYTFDGCIHWLVGAKPDAWFFQLYSESGALVGEHRVTIRTAAIYYEEEDCDCDKADPIPPQYNDRSQLLRSVEASANVFDFELQSAASEQWGKRRGY